MKLKIPLYRLRAAFQSVASVSPGRTPKPVLQNVLAQANGKTLTLTASNQETSVRCTLEGVEIEDDSGNCLLPTAKFGQILKVFMGDTVGISGGDGLIVTGDRSKSTLQTASPDEFPRFTNPKEYTLTVDGEQLGIGLSRVLPATDTESTRYAVGGVFLEVIDGKLRFVATDTRRLYIHEIPCEGKFTATNIVVPEAACRALARLTGTVELSASESALSARSGELELHTRLVEGRFPMYQDFVKVTGDTKARILAGSFLPVVANAKVTTAQESRGMLFRFAKGELVVSSQAADSGKSECRTPLEIDGPDTEVTIDPQFIEDGVRSLRPEDEVLIGLTDSESPVTFRSGASLFLVMPLGERG